MEQQGAETCSTGQLQYRHLCEQFAPGQKLRIDDVERCILENEAQIRALSHQSGCSLCKFRLAFLRAVVALHAQNFAELIKRPDKLELITDCTDDEHYLISPRPSFSFDDCLFAELCVTGPAGVLDLYLAPGLDDAGRSRLYRPFLSSTAVPAIIYQQINSWLDDCQSHNSPCSILWTQRQDSIPRRLLHIAEQTVSLCEDITDTSYVSLSHCWGPNPEEVLQLHRQNLLELKAGIPIDTLPRTFRDAVHVCRGAGMKHIWIDSLCILQDSLQDWQEQAPQMALIYTYAEFTIAAVRSSSPHDGLFPSEHIGQPSGVPLSGYPDKYLHCCGAATSTPQKVSYQNEHEYSGPTPLRSRAWAYQERELSPRLVEFLENEIIWTCGTLCTAHNLCPKNGFVQRGLSSRICYLDVSLVDIKKVWENVVNTYSSLELTYPEDRLPAIAAIAQRCAPYFSRKDYLLGIWKDNWVHDLLWFVDRPCTTPQSGNIQASWSWASADRVRYRSLAWHRILEVAQLLETNILCQGSPFLGIAKRATLTIRAPFLDTVLLQEVHPDESLDWETASGNSTWLAIGIVGTRQIPLIADRCSAFKHYREVYRITDLHLDRAMMRSSVVSLVFLGAWTPLNLMDPRAIHSLEGLVLERSPGQSNRYRRAGHFQIWPSDLRLGHAIRAPLDEQEQTQSDALQNEGMPEGMCYLARVLPIGDFVIE